MGKVDVGGGKPLAPSPKRPVAAPAPKHVYMPRSFPKPSRASVYRGSAAHQVSHSTGHGPRPTGSGVHAAVRAQPVQSKGHSANIARLASMLAARGGDPLGGVTTFKGSSVWDTPINWQKALGQALLQTMDAADLPRELLGLSEWTPRSRLTTGPQGGMYFPRNPRQPYDTMPPRASATPTVPIPKFNVSPRWRQGPQAGQPKSRSAQQRGLGLQNIPPSVRSPGSPRGLANPNYYGSQRA